MVLGGSPHPGDPARSRGVRSVGSGPPTQLRLRADRAAAAGAEPSDEADAWADR